MISGIPKARESTQTWTAKRFRDNIISSGPWADQHAVYSLRIHFHDLETKTEQVEGLGNTGNVTKLGDDQAGKGVKVAAGKLGEVE